MEYYIEDKKKYDDLNAEDYFVELYGQDLRISYSASTGIATITTGINVNDNWFEKGYRLDASKVYQYDVKNNKAIGETDETIVKTLHDMLPNYNVNFGEALNNIRISLLWDGTYGETWW